MTNPHVCMCNSRSKIWMDYASRPKMVEGHCLASFNPHHSFSMARCFLGIYIRRNEIIEDEQISIMEETHTILLTMLLVLIVLPAPTNQEIVTFTAWLKKQPTNSSNDEGCIKKDPTLATAEGTRVHNTIDPTTELNPEDGYYKTISEAINNIPEGNAKRYVLTVKGGTVFREKILLQKTKPFVTIKSDDPGNPAVIVWNDTATTIGKDGKPLGVDGSSTVTIESDYFIAYGVIFKNDAPLPKPGASIGEAPALRVLGTKTTFYNCSIDGGQGALYDQQGLHYFKACTIKGTIDFIFGSAKSLYEDCNIISTNKEVVPGPEAPSKQSSPSNPIQVAPGESGFSFKTCHITGEGERIYLGRVGTPAIYSYTTMSKEIAPIVSDQGNVQMPMRGLYCAVFKCYGPGLEPMAAIRLTYAEAMPFIGTHFVSGGSWILSLPPADE
ncbi:hypothetical protein ACP70R_003652 [Stipagrostis hirtigluma subsp. patula]